jgi:hypothetical protein
MPKLSVGTMPQDIEPPGWSAMAAVVRAIQFQNLAAAPAGAKIVNQNDFARRERWNEHFST